MYTHVVSVRLCSQFPVSSLTLTGETQLRATTKYRKGPVVGSDSHEDFFPTEPRSFGVAVGLATSVLRSESEIVRRFPQILHGANPFAAVGRV